MLVLPRCLLTAWPALVATPFTTFLPPTAGYEHNEETRPQYNEKAKQAPSPVDGLPSRFYSNFFYRSKITISTVRVLLLDKVSSSLSSLLLPPAPPPPAAVWWHGGRQNSALHFAAPMASLVSLF